MTTTNRNDCCTVITKAIIADLEKGTRPWVRPWATGAENPCRPLRHNGEPYRGINALWLWRSAALAGYRSPRWLTFRQAQELGGRVRKGEKSALVVYANLYMKTEDDDAREPEEKKIPFLKAYSVFNADQCDNLPKQFVAGSYPRETGGFKHKPHERAVRFFANTGAAIHEDAECARYSILEDAIHMPPFRRFERADRYYSTLAHELTHWTGHPKRTPRVFPKAPYSLATYAREELVAELGAAFLCADLGINLTPREDHADYIGHWLQILWNDKRAIFQAAAYAQKATDYLHGLQPSTIRRAA